jgi:hypothetical protein
MKDLALLVADKNMDFAMRGILNRPKALGIRPVTFEIRQHVNRDGGVRTTGPETLALLRKQFHRGIAMLDWEGSRTKPKSAIELERDLDVRLARSWGDRAKAIVIEPELDVWIWGSENALIKILEWPESQGIREWLAEPWEFSTVLKSLRPEKTTGHSGRDDAGPGVKDVVGGVCFRLSVEPVAYTKADRAAVLPWNQRREQRSAASTSELGRPAACLNSRPKARTAGRR